MFNTICVEKLYKGSRITGYKLRRFDSKKEVIVSARDLKISLLENNINVINLKLTSDNRIIDVKISDDRIKEIMKIESMISKAKLLGTYSNVGDVHIINVSDNLTLAYIPETINQLYANTFSDTKRNLKIIGGNGLITTSYMFYKCEFDSLDISCLDMSNVTDASLMFNNCIIKNGIDMRMLNSSKVEAMNYMFSDCISKSIILNGIDTSKVKSMHKMFFGCTCDNIDLRNLNTSNVNDMTGLFSYCTTKELDLTGFSDKSLVNLEYMFYNLKCETLDIRGFFKNSDTNYLTTLCRAKEILR